MGRTVFCGMVDRMIKEERKAGGSDYVALGSEALKAGMPSSVRNTINGIAEQELSHRDKLEKIRTTYCKRR